MNEAVLEKYMGKPINKMAIGEGHMAMTLQSSDCDSIAVWFGEEIISFTHIPAGENGDMAIERIMPEEDSQYYTEVDLSGGTYRLEKVVHEDGYLDMVVFASERDFLHIMSSDWNLIVNKSIQDLSGPTYVCNDPSILLSRYM